METDMNVIMLLKRKSSVCYIYSTSTVRQALEKMRVHGYSAVPVITESGKYVGCISEGDFLWHIIGTGDGSIKNMENYRVTDILRPDFCPAVRVDVGVEELLEQSLKQNFIPVVDDRDVFIGIVTRQDIISHVADEAGITGKREL